MAKAIARSLNEEYDGLKDSVNPFTIHFNAVQQKVGINCMTFCVFDRRQSVTEDLYENYVIILHKTKYSNKCSPKRNLPRLK